MGFTREIGTIYEGTSNIQLMTFTVHRLARRSAVGGGRLATGRSCLAMAVYRMSLFSSRAATGIRWRWETCDRAQLPGYGCVPHVPILVESSYWHQMEAGNLRPGSDEAEALLTSS